MATRAGRDSSEIRLLPVSETKPPEAVLETHATEYRRFRESRMQKAQSKQEALWEVTGIEWVIIGHPQSNKAKYVARFATEFQALDSLKVTSELDHRLQQEGRRLEVLIQVNSSDEDQKFGLPPQEVVAFAKRLNTFNVLDVWGLMTLALFTGGTEHITRCFKMIRQVQQELRDVTEKGWDELSMGISGDFELAIEYGATCVHVDQAIFGSRLDPNAYQPGIK